MPASVCPKSGWFRQRLAQSKSYTWRTANSGDRPFSPRVSCGQSTFLTCKSGSPKSGPIDASLRRIPARPGPSPARGRMKASMASLPHSKTVTYEEWLRMPEVGDAIEEVVNGEIQIMPAPGWDHCEIING